MNKNLFPNAFSTVLGPIQANEMVALFFGNAKTGAECSFIPHVIFHTQSTVPMGSQAFLPLIWNLMLSYHCLSRKYLTFVAFQHFIPEPTRG